MSGSSGGQKIVTPEAPKPQTVAESIQDWIGSVPQIFSTQQKYAPQEAQQQLSMLQQYALPMAQAYQQAQQSLYPETAKLQESLAGQAMQGMQAKVPDWMQQQYLSDLRSNLGSNVTSPIAADYQSRGLMQLQKDFNDYYRNLALSTASAMPLVSPQMPQYTNYMSGFSPSSVMNYNAQNYGTYAQATRPLVVDQGQPAWATALTAGGNLMQGAGGMGIGFGKGQSFGGGGGAASAAGLATSLAPLLLMSSKKLKKNINKTKGSLSKIKKLEGVLFNWKENNMPDGGFIAEEVEKIMPEATTEIDGIKAIKPLVIIAHLVEAVKELSKIKGDKYANATT